MEEEPELLGDPPPSCGGDWINPEESDPSYGEV